MEDGCDFHIYSGKIHYNVIEHTLHTKQHPWWGFYMICLFYCLSPVNVNYFARRYERCTQRCKIFQALALISLIQSASNVAQNSIQFHDDSVTFFNGLKNNSILCLICVRLLSKMSITSLSPSFSLCYQDSDAKIRLLCSKCSYSALFLSVFTSCNGSCRKVMFSQASVCSHGG